MLRVRSGWGQLALGLYGGEAARALVGVSALDISRALVKTGAAGQSLLWRRAGGGVMRDVVEARAGSRR